VLKYSCANALIFVRPYLNIDRTVLELIEFRFVAPSSVSFISHLPLSQLKFTGDPFASEDFLSPLPAHTSADLRSVATASGLPLPVPLLRIATASALPRSLSPPLPFHFRLVI